MFRAGCPQCTGAQACALLHRALEAFVSCQKFNNFRATCSSFRNVHFSASGDCLVIVSLIELYTDRAVCL